MMQADLINIMLGFFEGIGLILSPCILPILPIILSASLVGSKKRPLGIVVGFIIIFSVFTFFSRQLVRYTNIDLNAIRHVSYALLFLLGIMMMSTFLTEKFSQWTRRFANVGSNFKMANDVQGGFLSGVIFGSLIAFIWTPCAGPILAAVIVQTVIQQTNWISFLILLAFSIGVAIPMFLIVWFGRSIMAKAGFLTKHTEILRKLLGVIIIASVGYMVYNEGVSVAYAKVEQAQSLREGITPYPAPAIEGITAWINSPALQINELRGKVVLIDFWTYSCINCKRTLPYIKGWYERYHDKGLVIIGVHAPEFDFEKHVENVKNAVANDGIKYAVALDNNFVTWRNYQNRYWPAHYLINQQGQVVYQHFGEGAYDVMENNIQFLLGLKQSHEASEEKNYAFDVTPETYLGSARADRFASPESLAAGKVTNYSYPQSLSKHEWALQGKWLVSSDKIVSEQPFAGLKMHFNARYVYMVMGNATNKPITVDVLLNGEKIISEKGSDVSDSHIIVNQHTLYSVVALNRVNDGILQIIASQPGLEVFTFTFGS